MAKRIQRFKRSGMDQKLSKKAEASQWLRSLFDRRIKTNSLKRTSRSVRLYRGWVGQAFDAETDFGQRHGAHIKEIERLSGNEGEDFAFRLGTAQFRQDVDIEEPTRHQATSRTGMGSRRGSMSRCGDACMAAMSACPARSPVRRRILSSR
jgi:hypothetical protein